MEGHILPNFYFPRNIISQILCACLVLSNRNFRVFTVNQPAKAPPLSCSDCSIFKQSLIMGDAEVESTMLQVEMLSNRVLVVLRS